MKTAEFQSCRATHKTAAGNRTLSGIPFSLLRSDTLSSKTQSYRDEDSQNLFSRLFLHLVFTFESVSASARQSKRNLYTFNLCPPTPHKDANTSITLNNPTHEPFPYNSRNDASDTVTLADAKTNHDASKFFRPRNLNFSKT